MHKQLKKLGLFFSNINVHATGGKSDDEQVKCLYKKENEISGKPHKKHYKLRNPQEIVDLSTKHVARKYTDDSKHKKRKREYSESKSKRHTKHEFINPCSSETEIYYISPEEIKKHRKKSRKSKEKLSEILLGGVKKKQSRRSTESSRETIKKKTQDVMQLLIKAHNQTDAKDSQWLTKKEILKLLNQSKYIGSDNAINADLLKKFFVLDKQNVDQHKINSEEVDEREYFKKKSSIEMPFKEPVMTSPSRKVQKVIKEPKQQKHHPEVNEVDLYLSHFERHRSRPRDVLSIPKAHSHMEYTETPQQKNKKKRTKGDIADDSRVNKIKEMKNVCSYSIGHDDTKNCKTRKIEEKKSLNQIVRVDKTNPERHKKCLVRRTFSIVEIKSTEPHSIGSVEKKKKSKAFKKYYNYQNNENSEIKYETYNSWSDSNKIYQEMSEPTMAVTMKNTHKTEKRKKELKTETYVSSVVAVPQISKNNESPVNNQNDEKHNKKSSKLSVDAVPKISKNTENSIHIEDDEKKNKKSKLIGVYRSKIPIFNKNLESPKETSTAKSCENKTVPASKNKISSSKTDKEKSIDKIKEKVSSSFECKKKKSVEPSKIPSKIPSPKTNKEKIVNKSSVSKNTSKTNEVKEKCNKIKDNNVPTKTKTASGSQTKQKGPLPKPKESSSKAFSHTSEEPNRHDSKMSASSNISKRSKSLAESRKSVEKEKIIKNRTQSSPPPTYRKSETRKTPRSRDVSMSKTSNDGSLWSKSSKNTNKSFASKSDPKFEQDKKKRNEKKCKTFERTSTKGSFSNSTVDDKSLESTKKATTFLLTKTYRDDDKMTRWQKRKIYADIVRRNLYNKNQKIQIAPPQVLEVRYLTVSHDNQNVELPQCENQTNVKDENLEEPKLEEIKTQSEASSPKKEFYEDDLPPAQPSTKLVSNEKLNELFESPIDNAFDEILNENYNFLKKDFSYSFDKSDSSSDDDSISDLKSLEGSPYSLKKEPNDSFNSAMGFEESFSEISCSNKMSNESRDDSLALESEDHIVDSSSAPGSDESGYSTLKSRQISDNFFRRPSIKALINPSIDYCHYNVHTEIESSNINNFKRCLTESKSLQTTIIECSQKSVQLLPEFIQITSTNDSELAEEKTEIKEDNGTEVSPMSSEDLLTTEKCKIERKSNGKSNHEIVKTKQKKNRPKGLKKLFLCCFTSNE